MSTPTPPPAGASATTKALLFAGAAIELINGTIAEWLPDHVAVIVASLGTGIVGLGALYHVYYDHASA